MPPVFVAIGFSAAMANAIVVGAVIGAAIGGITAAITGGDIFKGVLFGAIGGAVGGALVHGIGTVFSQVGGNLTTVSSGAGMGSVGPGAGQAMSTAALQGAGAGVGPGAGQAMGSTVVTGATETVKKSGGTWLSRTLGSIGGEIGEGMGQAAVAGGIEAVATTYQQGRGIEAAKQAADANFERELVMLEESHQNALELIAARGEGGSGGGPSYRPLSEELALADANRETVLAKVNAELDAQTALKEQEFGRIDADRELMAASAGALQLGNRTGSRSTQTLEELQERARQQPPIDTGAVPPVEYVA